MQEFPYYTKCCAGLVTKQIFAAMKAWVSDFPFGGCLALNSSKEYNCYWTLQFVSLYYLKNYLIF